MIAIFTTLFSLLSGLPGVIGDYFKKKQEIEQQKLNNEYAIEVEKEKLAAQLAQAESDRAEQAIQSTGMWFKYCVFWLLASPFIACLFNYPEYAQHLFSNLNTLPEWYLIIFTGMVGVIWGIPVPGSVMGNIWEGIKEARANSREFKLEKLRINRKQFYDTARQVSGQPLSQQYVAQTEKVFDAIDNQQ